MIDSGEDPKPKREELTPDDPNSANPLQEVFLSDEGAHGIVHQLVDQTGFPLGVKKAPKDAAFIPILQSELDFLHAHTGAVSAQFSDYGIHWFKKPIKVVTNYVRLQPDAMKHENREKGIIFEDFAYGEPVITNYVLNESLPFCLQAAGIMGEIEQLARLSDEGLTLDTHMDEIRVNPLKTVPIVFVTRFDCQPQQRDHSVPCPVTPVWPNGRRTMQDGNIDWVTETLNTAFGNSEQTAGKDVFSDIRKMFRVGKIITFKTLLEVLKDKIQQTPSDQLYVDLIRLRAIGLSDWVKFI